ncbi:MAG: aminoglycoside phosphotransferase family protein [Actinomycetota bacterium]
MRRLDDGGMRRALHELRDERLGPLPTLLGEPEAPLGAAVGASGGELLSVRPRQVGWNPGRDLTVRYDARIRRPDGEHDEMLVATCGSEPPGGLRVEGPDGPVTIWQAPQDPWLPGLHAVTDPAMIEDLLDDLGAGPGETSRRLVAYRPGRRAVVRLRRGSSSVFVKVVRPDRAERIHRNHLAVEAVLPVPRTLGFAPDAGFVVLQALPGTVLRTALARPVRPGAEALLGVLDLLPEPTDGRRSAGWRTRSFGPLLRRLRPDLAARIDALEAANRRAEEAVEAPTVPVHGDFHEAQLLVDGRRITGVLDIDTLALGHRIEDLATMIGHLSTLALGRRRVEVERYAAAMLRRFDAVVDPVALRSAVSSVVLGLATGPFRVLQDDWHAATGARIELAERWAASAVRVAAERERNLMTVSDPLQLGCG